MHNDLQTRLPPITISARDAEKLRHLADAAANMRRAGKVATPPATKTSPELAAIG
jgi:hypothetical protein